MTKPGSQIEIPGHPRKVRDFWQKLLLLMVTAQMQGPKDVIVSRVRVGRGTDKSVENSNISWRIPKFIDASIIRVSRWIDRENLFTNYNSAKEAIKESKDKILVPISTLLHFIGQPQQKRWDYPVFDKKGAGFPHGVELDKLVPENVPGHQLFRIAVAFGFCPKCPRDYLEIADPLPEMECDRVRWIEELQFNPERFDEWADEHKKPIENQQACAIWEAFAGKALEEDPEMAGGEPFDDFLTKWCDRVSHDNKAEQAGVLVNDENRPVELIKIKLVFEEAMLNTNGHTDRTATNSPSEVIPVDNGDSPFYLQWPQKMVSPEDLNGFNRLMYTSDIDEFFGREYEIKLLQDFAGDLSSGGQVFNFRWMLLTGEAGTGKTRLAYHFTRHVLDEVWYNGKLDFASLKAFHYPAKWRPVRPTFIVIDYVECVPEEVGKLLKAFTDQAVNFEKPVRLLLLARSANSAWTDKLLQVKGDRPVIEQHNFGGDSIRGKKIKQLSLDAIFKLMKRRIQLAQLDVPEKNYLLSKAHDIDRRFEKPRPLFALLAVEHYIETKRMGQDLPEKFELTAVLEDFIRREQDNIWSETITNVGELRRYEMGLAVATLAQGIKLRDLNKANFGSGYSWLEIPIPPDHVSGALAAFGCTSSYWPQMEPDLVGEYFISQKLMDNKLDKEERVALIEGAMLLDKSQAVITLLRLAQDFPKRFKQLHLEDVARATAYEKALRDLLILVVHMTNKAPDSCGASKIFDAVFGREDWNTSRELGVIVFKAAVNICTFAGNDGNWDRVAEMLLRLDAVRKAFPQDQEIARDDAMVAFNICTLAGNDGNWDRVAEMLLRLDAVRKKFHQDQEIALEDAKAASNTCSSAVDVRDWGRVAKMLLRLDAVREAFPQSQEIAQADARAAFNILTYAVVDGEMGLVAEVLSRIDAVQNDFPQDQEIAREMAKNRLTLTHISGSRGDAYISRHRGKAFTHQSGKVGRNEPCPCGSGKKFKKCCGQRSNFH